MPHRRGGGGRWTSLHESTSVCPPLLIISAPCTDFTTYIFCTTISLHLHNTHTHTHKHKTTILHYPSSQAQQQTLYFFCTIHTSSTRSLSSWTPTLSKSLHSVQ